MPWQFLENSAGVSHESTAPAFAHTLLYDEQKSDRWPIWKPVISQIELEQGLSRQDLFRARVGLYLPSPHYPTNPKHTDNDVPHTVALYYINESDGDTVLYDPQTRIAPRRGHYILFPGDIPHSSSNPSHHPRLTLNLNYRTEPQSGKP